MHSLRGVSSRFAHPASHAPARTSLPVTAGLAAKASSRQAATMQVKEQHSKMVPVHTHTALPDWQPSWEVPIHALPGAVDMLKSAYSMPAADWTLDQPIATVNTDNTATLAVDDDSVQDVAALGSTLVPVWLPAAELQHLSYNTPHSGSCCGSSEAGITTWHAADTLHSQWDKAAAQLPAVTAATGADRTTTAAAGSAANRTSSCAVAGPANSPQGTAVSSQSSNLDVVYMANGDGTTHPMMVDVLSPEVSLIETKGDYTPEEVAALRDELDDMYKLTREARGREAKLRARIAELEAAAATNNRTATSSDSSLTTREPLDGAAAASSSTAGGGCAACQPLSGPKPSPDGGKTNMQLKQRCQVHFSIARPTAYGQRVWLVGDAAALGGWSLESAVRLKWSEGGKWQGSIQLDSSTKSISYKAVLEVAPGEYRWASGDNCTLRITSSSHSVQHMFN